MTGTSENSDVNETEKRFKCVICSKMFHYNYQMNLHYRVHTGVRPFSCTHCEKTFTQKHALKTHMTIKHSKQTPHECSACGKQFSGKHSLTKHIKTCTISTNLSSNSSEILHNCLICNKALTKKDVPTHPLTAHSGKKPFSCTHCKKPFIYENALKTHMTMNHSVETQCKCSSCGKQFSWKCCWTKHMENCTKPTNKSSNSSEVLYNCLICNKKLTMKDAMTDHLTAHADERSATCPICKLSFVNLATLKNHFHSCDGYENLKTLATLASHQKLTEEYDLFVCGLCGKIYIEKDSLHSHLEIHKVITGLVSTVSEIVKTDEHIQKKDRSSSILDSSILHYDRKSFVGTVESKSNYQEVNSFKIPFAVNINIDEDPE